METLVSVALMQKLVDKFEATHDKVDHYVFRVYFENDADINDDGQKNRINIKLAGTMFNIGRVLNIWMG